jgi:hypothetical protein
LSTKGEGDKMRAGFWPGIFLRSRQKGISEGITAARGSEVRQEDVAATYLPKMS